MITNLVIVCLSTTLLTNVTYTYPKGWVLEPTGPEPFRMTLGSHMFKEIPNPTSRTRTEEVWELKVLSGWPLEKEVEVSRRLVSTVSVREEKVETWKTVGPTIDDSIYVDSYPTGILWGHVNLRTNIITTNSITNFITNFITTNSITLP